MRSVKVHEAKTHFSKLLSMVETGEEVLVNRGDKPVAKIVAYEPPVNDRVPGRRRGQVWMADDFDAIPPEFNEYLI